MDCGAGFMMRAERGFFNNLEKVNETFFKVGFPGLRRWEGSERRLWERTVTSCPARRSAMPAERPAMPPPTMMIFIAIFKKTRMVSGSSIWRCVVDPLSGTRVVAREVTLGGESDGKKCPKWHAALSAMQAKLSAII